MINKAISKFIPGKTRVLYGGPVFGKEEDRAIQLARKREKKGWLGLDVEGKAFEQEIAAIQGVKKAVFVNSGTSALDIGLRAMDLPKGSEVIVPACTFPTPIASLINLGLIPVVADVDLGSYFLSPESVEKSISKKTKAIFVVYVAGAVGYFDKIISIAKKYNLSLIEDNCDGFGGQWKGKMLGSFGKFSAISTHVAHIITTYGEGGVMFTNDISLGERARSIREWGRDKIAAELPINGDEDVYGLPSDMQRFIYTELGVNYKPLDLQAAVGRVQLTRLGQFKKIRIRNFMVLQKILESLDDKIFLPYSSPNANPCWYTYPITLRDSSRRDVLNALNDANIEWRPILASNIARQPAFKGKVVVRTKLPNADAILERGFWVPVHPRHSIEVMEYVGNVLKKAIKK